MTDLTLLLLTHRSVLKRGPFGTEDDFIVPPPTKLTRTEEPKRGVLGPGDKWESLDHSELRHLASLASPPCMFVLQTTTSPSVGEAEFRGGGRWVLRLALGWCVLLSLVELCLAVLTRPCGLFMHLLMCIDCFSPPPPPSAALCPKGVRRSLRCSDAQDAVFEGLDGGSK